MLDMRIPVRQRLANRKAHGQYLNTVEGPGGGYDGEGRHRIPVISGSEKWFGHYWRNVEYCDDVADSSVRHKGWHADEDGDQVVRGVVVQLPSRNGAEVWLAGYEDTGGNYVYHLDGTYESATVAASVADVIAERTAERERQYNAQWQEKQQREDWATEVEEHRADIKALWPHRNDNGCAAPVRALARESILSHIEDIRKLGERIERSVSDWGDLDDVE